MPARYAKRFADRTRAVKALLAGKGLNILEVDEHDMARLVKEANLPNFMTIGIHQTQAVCHRILRDAKQAAEPVPLEHVTAREKAFLLTHILDMEKDVTNLQGRISRIKALLQA